MRALKLTAARCILLIPLLLVPCPALAQSDFVIDAFAVDSGGGASSGEDFGLISTIGQPYAGAMSGTDYALEGGVWSIVEIPQPGEPPLLRITLAVPNSVTISWPAPASDWVLEHSLTLGPSANWTDVGAPVIANASDNTVIQPIAPDGRFYRLRHP